MLVVLLVVGAVGAAVVAVVEWWAGPGIPRQ